MPEQLTERQVKSVESLLNLAIGWAIHCAGEADLAAGIAYWNPVHQKIIDDGCDLIGRDRIDIFRNPALAEHDAKEGRDG